MYKKTVLRRLCKLIEKDFDSAEQRKVYEAADGMEFDKEKTVEVSPFDDIIIDAEFEDVKEPEEPKEQQEEPKSKPKTEKLELSVEDAKAKQG